jgi:hypothetical protein
VDISRQDIRRKDKAWLPQPLPIHRQDPVPLLQQKAKFLQETCLREATHLEVPSPPVISHTEELKIELSASLSYSHQL